MMAKAIVADFAAAKAMVGAQVVDAGVPVLIHREAGVIWEGHPVPRWEWQAGRAQLHNLRAVAEEFWPEFAGEVDWWE